MNFAKFSGGLAALMLMLGPCLGWADVGTTVRELIENQRRILVLREAVPREAFAESRRAGQFLFFSNQHLSQKLIHEIIQTPQDEPLRYREMASAMDDPSYAEEDRLVLRATLEGLAHRLPADQRRDVLQRLGELSKLRSMLGADFGAAFQHMPLKPGRPTVARWNSYISGLARAMTAERILADLDHELVAEPEPNLPISEATARARVLEWNGEELPDHVVLLTFDDGPHPVHTPAVLDILKRHEIRALFFQVGRNLGEVKNGVATPERNQELEARLIAEGHAVGNHSYTHPLLPKLDSQGVAREIADTQALIEAMVPADNARSGGFRPPYGARDDKVLAQIDLHHLRSVVWNIDSEDWSDPLPESIAHRVVRETEKYGRGIVLMHDIHARTVDALPQVIAELKKRGFRFAYWDGQRLVSAPDSRDLPAN